MTVSIILLKNRKHLRFHICGGFFSPPFFFFNLFGVFLVEGYGVEQIIHISWLAKQNSKQLGQFQ